MGLTRRIACLAFAVFCLSVPLARASGPWDGAASDLAEQIAAHLSRNSAITLEVNNRSTLGSNEISEIASVLRAQLTGRHIRVIATKRPVPGVLVTISENMKGFLWIAEIQHDKSHEVVMVQSEKPDHANSAANPEALVIYATLLIEQREPILDLAQFDSADSQPSLLVLDTGKVALYGKREAGWFLQQSMTFKRSNPWPRDPRGRLVMGEAGAFAAFTPGMECHGSVNPLIKMECKDGEADWPVGPAKSDGAVAHFVPNRNYFDGKIKIAAEETQVPEFFTAARVGATPGAFTIYANLDGRARMFGKGPQPASQFDGWGSDITSVQSGCASGFQILATRSGSMEQAGSIQAFIIRGRDAVAVSAPAEFGGPVTALWSAQDGSTAMAVVHDLSTGTFDAFSIAISCGR